MDDLSSIILLVWLFLSRKLVLIWYSYLVLLKDNNSTTLKIQILIDLLLLF
jgi:hypothetical protein